MPDHISDTLKLVQPPPEEPAKQTFTQRLASEVGIHQETLRKYLKHARWTPEQLRAATTTPDWWTRLQHDARERELDRRVRDVGPDGFGGLTDEQILDHPKLAPKLRAWIEGFDGRSAVLLGPTGCGKSLSSFCVLRRVQRARADQDLPPSWSPLGYTDGTWRDHDSCFHGGWIAAEDALIAHRGHPLGRGEHPDIRRAKTCALLVLDDVTWPTRDDVTREILGARYSRGLSTIVTAGSPRDELMSRFRDATFRRFLDAAGERGSIVDCFRGGK